jgi:hypothetical protein
MTAKDRRQPNGVVHFSSSTTSRPCTPRGIVLGEVPQMHGWLIQRSLQHSARVAATGEGEKGMSEASLGVYW